MKTKKKLKETLKKKKLKVCANVCVRECMRERESVCACMRSMCLHSDQKVSMQMK